MQVAVKRAVLMLALGMSFLASAHAAEETANEARAWLARMSEALATRNYDVRFLHLVGGHAENMRIIHSVADGVVTERLVSLDGSGREVIRTQTEVVCYLPDRRTVLVEKRTDNSSLLGTVPVFSEGLQSNYELATPGTTRILGRPAQFVTVQPRDNFRYGYRLWLDQETALPLKSQLCDRSGRVIEQIVFSDLSTPASIDAALLKSSIPTAGFQWIRQEMRVQRLPRDDANVGAWVVANPPQGFRLTVTRMQNIGDAGPVRHLVLSDGLASVSVFIEPAHAKQEASVANATAVPHGAPELSRVGSALAYSTEAHDHRITAVGEVPANTLRAIATSVQRESEPGAQSPSAQSPSAQSKAPTNDSAPDVRAR
jgi:sigma-E factor negative regulatory protein RseB